jgi:hypothetical protein
MAAGPVTCVAAGSCWQLLSILLSADVFKPFLDAGFGLVASKQVEGPTCGCIDILADLV